MDFIWLGRWEAGVSPHPWAVLSYLRNELGAGSFLKISVMRVPSLPGFESIADFRVLIWFVDASSGWRTSRPELKYRHSVPIEDVIVATCAECTDAAQSHPQSGGNVNDSHNLAICLSRFHGARAERRFYYGRLRKSETFFRATSMPGCPQPSWIQPFSNSLRCQDRGGSSSEQRGLGL